MVFDERQTATILAALRCFQEHDDDVKAGFPQFHEGLEPLTNKQIDRLCEAINTDESAVKVIVEVDGGCVNTVYASDKGVTVDVLDWDNGKACEEDMEECKELETEAKKLNVVWG